MRYHILLRKPDVVPSDGDRNLTIQPALNTYPENAVRNNAEGSDLDKGALERFKVREICEG